MWQIRGSCYRKNPRLDRIHETKTVSTSSCCFNHLCLVPPAGAAAAVRSAAGNQNASRRAAGGRSGALLLPTWAGEGQSCAASENHGSGSGGWKLWCSFLHFCPSRTNELLIELKIADCSNIFFFWQTGCISWKNPMHVVWRPIEVSCSCDHWVCVYVCLGAGHWEAASWWTAGDEHEPRGWPEAQQQRGQRPCSGCCTSAAFPPIRAGVRWGAEWSDWSEQPPLCTLSFKTC